MKHHKNIQSVTFILPCAGQGRRLGYNGHKELFPVFSDRRLIDYSLDHIQVNTDWLLRNTVKEICIAVVIRPEKTDVADYVRKKLPGLRVENVLFDDTLYEWPGSVHSARNFYADCNIVLLPDTYLSLGLSRPTLDTDGHPLASHVLRCMQTHSVVFGCHPCDDPAVLKRFGAVRIEHADKPVIRVFRDKPDSDLNRYNGFWCCYAFTADTGESLYQFLRRSVLHQPADILKEPFSPVAVFPVNAYHDLGFPESVRYFRSCYGSESSNTNSSCR